MFKRIYTVKQNKKNTFDMVFKTNGDVTGSTFAWHAKGHVGWNVSQGKSRIKTFVHSLNLFWFFPKTYIQFEYKKLARQSNVSLT